MAADYTNTIVCERKFMESLVDFKRLAVLEIHNDTNPDITLFHLLQACPSLSTLLYNSTFPVPKNAAQQLVNMIEGLKGHNSSISQVHKNLKKVKLSTPGFPTPYIGFFKTHAPESLDDVEIEITHICMREWIFIETMDVVLDFCVSLQKFTFVTLKFEKEWQVEHQKMGSFYQVLNALTGNKKFHIRSANYKNYKKMSSLTSVEIRIAGPELYYDYCLDIQNYLALNDHKIRRLWQQNYNTTSTSTLEQLAMVDQFSIHFNPVDFEYVHIPKYCFEYSKRFFPNITQFRINSMFKNFFLEAKCPVNYESLQHMTYLNMDGSYRPQDLMMDDIPKYLPNIKVLTFGLRISFKFHSDQALFKLANFENLQTLEIDIEHMEHFECGPIFLKYTDGSRQTTHYLLKINTTKNGNNKFEEISAKDMNRGVKQDFMKGYFPFAIIVEGSQQLKRIEFKNRTGIYTELDFESDM